MHLGRDAAPPAARGRSRHSMHCTAVVPGLCLGVHPELSVRAANKQNLLAILRARVCGGKCVALPRRVRVCVSSQQVAISGHFLCVCARRWRLVDGYCSSERHARSSRRLHKSCNLSLRAVVVVVEYEIRLNWNGMKISVICFLDGSNMRRICVAKHKSLLRRSDV